MGLLDLPSAPRLGTVYDMPPSLYDQTDDHAHPVLVIAIDSRMEQAEVATRTTKRHAKGPNGVPHARDMDLDLDQPGWWRIDFTHWVPFANFEDPDVGVRGDIGDEAWARVRNGMEAQDTTGGGRW